MKISNLEESLDFLKFENEGKVEEIKKKLEQEETIREKIESKRKIQEKLSQQKISDLESELLKTTTTANLSSIIKNWEGRVVHISCDFSMENSYLRYRSEGSGVILELGGISTQVLTNRHVLIPDSNLYHLDFCKIQLSESNNFLIDVGDIRVSTSEYDWGILTINKQDSELQKIANSKISICENKPNLGDTVVVLGYPSIGSQNSVTATEGIISGFDGNYFITSAKVEQGNSGGAAILSKENCFLGIPTYATLGQVESLARILDIWTILVK